MVRPGKSRSTRPRHSMSIALLCSDSEVTFARRPLISRCRRWPRYLKGNASLAMRLPQGPTTMPVED
jgi:hypothetical protein